MISTPSLARQLADAVRGQAVHAGASEPTIRGANWRLATVQSVGTDGTITTTDGIVARRTADYLGAAAGQVVRIGESSTGNWISDGPLGSGSGTWVGISLASGWTTTAGYYTPAYQLLGDGTASLSGMASMSGALAAGTTVATLPAEARPASRVRATVQVAAAAGVGYYGVMTLQPDGTIILGDFDAALPATGSKYAQYDVFGRYRLT